MKYFRKLAHHLKPIIALSTIFVLMSFPLNKLGASAQIPPVAQTDKDSSRGCRLLIDPVSFISIVVNRENLWLEQSTLTLFSVGDTHISQPSGYEVFGLLDPSLPVLDSNTNVLVQRTKKNKDLPEINKYNIFIVLEPPNKEVNKSANGSRAIVAYRSDNQPVALPESLLNSIKHYNIISALNIVDTTIGSPIQEKLIFKFENNTALKLTPTLNTSPAEVTTTLWALQYVVGSIAGETVFIRGIDSKIETYELKVILSSPPQLTLIDTYYGLGEFSINSGLTQVISSNGEERVVFFSAPAGSLYVFDPDSRKGYQKDYLNSRSFVDEHFDIRMTLATASHLLLVNNRGLSSSFSVTELFEPADTFIQFEQKEQPSNAQVVGADLNHIFPSTQRNGFIMSLTDGSNNDRPYTVGFTIDDRGFLTRQTTFPLR